METETVDGTGTNHGDNLLVLLGRIVKRDESAFARFYDLSAAAAYGLAMKIMEDESLAEDVLSEAYVQVWQKADSYDYRRGNVMSWLLVIVRSRAIDLLRKRRLAIRTEELARRLEWSHESRDREPDLVDGIEARTLIHEALSRLPNGQRQVLALAFFRGLTHSEIARHTGMPLGTVKSMLRYSLNTLRGTLNPDLRPGPENLQ